jgi:O-methyltransferase
VTNRPQQPEASPTLAGPPGRIDLATRYLDLLAAALTHTLYRPIDTRPFPEEFLREFQEELQRKGETLVLRSPEEERAEGRDRPVYAQTMIGSHRLDNLRRCAEDVVRRGVPGDFIEAGAWRGGAGIMMRGVLAALGVDDRKVWVADSFAGLPQPDVDRYPADAGDINFMQDELAVSLEEVQGHFERYGLLDDQVRFLKGWFRDTLPTVSEETFSIVRLDGDLYESTIDGLRCLYPRLSVGGYLIVDDFGWDNCREAVEDYRAEHGIREEIQRIDWVGAYWQRTE